MMLIAPEHPDWPALVAHLHRANDARWVLSDDDQPHTNTFFLGIKHDDAIIASLTLKQQPITIPASTWSGGETHWLRGPDNLPLEELFVQTFTVEEVHRRQGHGKALQRAGLSLAAELGCYQLRSWSSLDRTANYALKLKLGFAAHPAIYTTDTGLAVSGVYFVKTVTPMTDKLTD
jgi:GNAT superfamily N-acetyltransferase